MRKRERGNQVEKQYNNITRWSFVFHCYEHVIVNSQGRRKKNTIRCSSVTAVKSHYLLLHTAICARQQTVSRECVSLSRDYFELHFPFITAMRVLFKLAFNSRLENYHAFQKKYLELETLVIFASQKSSI